jgi:putative DNA primase/helicase
LACPVGAIGYSEQEPVVSNGNGAGDDSADRPHRFVLSSDIEAAYRRYTDLVRAATPSQRLKAFTLAARRVAGLVDATDFPHAEAVDRLWTTAEAYGLILVHGVDAVQKCVAAAIADPILPTADGPFGLDAEADTREEMPARRRRQRRSKRQEREVALQFHALVRENAEARNGDDDLDLKLAWLPLTDLGNVERFVARYGSNLKWCATTGWLQYDGKRWTKRGTESYVLRAEHATVRAIQVEAKAIAKLASQERDKKRRDELLERAESLRAWGRISETAHKMSLAKRARAEMEVHHEQLDADPWRINVLNGTLIVRRPVDTAEGEPWLVLAPHNPDDLITKICPVRYDPHAECPDFDEFFLRVQPKPTQRRFILQWLGYSLTGDAEEQKVVVFWGPKGGNGKGTLMESVAYVAGDYADSVPIETFLQPTTRRSGSQPTPDLAKLPGVRYLRTGEPDKGAKLNESLIKRVTGGDPIDARDLNKSFFTFFAQFKLTIACNPKPRITGTDGGIWRRVILVPWEEQIPEAERDKHLKAKLRAEGSGILNRLLEGLRDYLEKGLLLGDEISEATANYRSESDAVGRFLAQSTVVEPNGRAQSTLLWRTYLAWATCNDGPQYSQVTFTSILTERGFRRIQNNVMYFEGITLAKKISDFTDEEGRPRIEDPSGRADDDRIDF